MAQIYKKSRNEEKENFIKNPNRSDSAGLKQVKAGCGSLNM